MPTLTLTDEQVIELVKQLAPEQQQVLLQFLLTKHWHIWVELSRYGEEHVRMATARRGRNWEKMTEDEREAFIDDLVYED